MRWPRQIRLRARSLFRRARVEQELEEELRFHMAHEDFSGVTQIQEECRDARGVRWLESLALDLRHGIRLMRRSPGFAAAAVLTIAIGAGSTTAIFSVVYGVLLQPLPYPMPDRLVSLWSRAVRYDLQRAFVSAANWRDWKEQSRTIEDIALVRHIANYNLTGDGEPERMQGARVTANLFRILGATPAIGRTFTEENESFANAYVVVLSNSLWKRRFGPDRAIVGRSILLNGIPHTVLGVMPPWFRYPTREFDLWAPLPIPADELRERLPYSYLAVGRLKPGVTIAEAQADLDAISARLEHTYAVNRGTSGGVARLLDDTVKPVAGALYLLLAAVGCLLITGAVNVANLLLARGLSRDQERAVRAALGASSARLVAQSIIEVLPIVACGVMLGILAASFSLRALISLMPPSMPRIEEIRVSGPVMGFSLLLLAITSLLVAFWPALQTARARIGEPLRAAGRANSSSRSHVRIREILVIAEAALTVALVAGACLLFRSFSYLRDVDPGFRSSHTLTLHLAISRTRYPKDPDVAAYLTRLIDRVEALPGVVAAGMVNRLPIIGGIQVGPIEFEGHNLALSRVGNADWRTATPDYFRALGIPITAGRVFSQSDTENARYVGLIDEVTARRVWPHQSAIGKRFRIAADGPWTEIVGVVGRVRTDALDTEARTQVYWNYRQRTQDRMALAVHTAGDPAALTAVVIAQIRMVDPQQPVYSVFTMEEILDRSVAQQRLNAALVAVFAAVALLLAAIGIYGVVAYSVNQRVREFGIRIALGASPGTLSRMVVVRGAVVAGIGVAAGLAASAALARFLSTLLFQVSATDWLSYSSAAVILLGVAVAASYIPVRRALADDPLIALRGE